MKARTALLLTVASLAGLFLTYKYGQNKSLIDFKDALLTISPRILTALLIIVLVQLFLRIFKPLLSKVFARLDQRQAVLSTFSLVLNVVALFAALSVLVGDVSTFITSLGLVGLGVTLALQTPILCFTGWILINVKRQYRVGDRIRVNDIYGDVTEIDFLTTTVWEYGSTWFTAEQPSGRLISIPNSIVLQTAVYNYTRDFPYIWDELAISMAYEGDLPHTKQTILTAARDVLGDSMAGPIRQYREILKQSNLDYSISEEPEVFMTFAESWANLHLRYLVPARQRRKIKTAISEKIFLEPARPENAAKIRPSYAKIQVQSLDKGATPRD